MAAAAAAGMDTMTCRDYGNATILFCQPVDCSFSCVICHEVCDDPVSCGRQEGCAALFCNSCLTESLQVNKKCPSCSFKINGKGTKSLVIKNLISGLSVFCIHRDSEATKENKKDSKKKRNATAMDSSICGWQGKLSTLDAHLKDCPGVAVPCSNQGCNAKPTRGALEEHAASCPHRKTPCQHCSGSFKQSEMRCHVTQDCKSVLVKCSCGSNVLRGQREAHLKTCPDVEITCPFGCSATLKRSALPTHNKMAAEEHNNLLLAKVCALESVNSLQAQNIKMSWKVPDMAEKILSAQNSMKHFYSSSFYVPRPGGGLEKMYLRFDLYGTKAGLYFLKFPAAQGSSTYFIDVDMSGWKLTVCGTAGLQDLSGFIPEGMKSNVGTGWEKFAADVTPYISLDAITITAEVKVNGTQTLELEMQ